MDRRPLSEFTRPVGGADSDTGRGSELNGSEVEEAVIPTVDTLLYGEVDLHYRDDLIVANYADEPQTAVSVHRMGVRTQEKTPIGTRSASNIRADIDGRAITISPGRARLFKRSYRIAIEFDAQTVMLSAKNLEDSVLIDGPMNNGDNIFGDLTRVYGGGVDVLWSLPFTFGKRTIEPPTPSRDVVLIGTAAAAAFGTGGLSAATIVMSIIGSWFPS